MKRLLLFSLVLLVAFGVSVPRARADVAVYVGYADNLRPSPFFPVGFGLGLSLGPISSGTTQVFTGGGTFDSGAILIVNTGASSITLDSLSATIPTWGTNPLGGPTASTFAGSTWAGLAGFSLLPGNGAIFTQTYSYNFDTSDFGAPGLNSASNCDPTNAFATANPANVAFCASIAPTVTISVNGTLLSVFRDTGQVLDTGGFDVAGANPCPNPAEPGGNCNESLQWRLIGTTGIGNPGGNTPEPASLLLLGTGILSLCGAVRKKLQA
jgi:PEP-CTERM motif